MLPSLAPARFYNPHCIPENGDGSLVPGLHETRYRRWLRELRLEFLLSSQELTTTNFRDPGSYSRPLQRRGGEILQNDATSHYIGGTAESRFTGY